MCNFAAVKLRGLTPCALVLTLLLAGLAGCSVKRNTGFSRGFQRMTSRYNVYLNGHYALQDAHRKIHDKLRDDYSHVLPVYEFYDKRNISPASGDLETVQRKSHKLVQLHSITVKPERKSGERLSDKDRRFYAKTEYNPLVPEGYLLMGIASVMQHEEDDAIKVFDFMGMQYGGERATYESKIWKSIAYVQKGYFNQALAALQSYDMDGDAPAPLYADYQAALANVYVAQDDWSAAIPYLQRAANETRSRRKQRRYTYILAQLYRITGQKELAAPLFLRVSRQGVDFDMGFAAKLDLATVATTPDELAAAEKSLEKMTRAGRYPDQQDQIWYSLGHLQKGRGNDEEALRCFRTSVARSTDNENQRGLSWLAIADLEQPARHYLAAGIACDSASAFLDALNVRKPEADERAALLHPLREQLQRIKDNDSLLALARMDEKERNKLFDALIKADKDRREAQRQAEEMGMDDGMSQSDFYNLQRTTAGGGLAGGRSSFYFYNVTLVTAGKQTFRSRWGNRKNEDNWRRSDKSSTNLADIEQELDSATRASQEAAELQAQMAEQEANAPLTREKLLANVPTTPEQQAQTEAETAQAFLKSAAILYDQVKDYPEADAQIEEMLRRYPRCDQRYDALALRHFVAKHGHLGATQSATDQTITREYPESLLARQIRDKGLLQSLSEERSRRDTQYRQTYEAYLRGELGTALGNANQALADTATTTLRPQYLLVRAMTQAKNGDAQAFRTDLTALTEKHAGTPQDSLAKLLLAELDKGRMPVRHQAYDSPLDKLKGTQRGGQDIQQVQYAYEPDSAHVIVCLVSPGRLRDAQFAVADYNFTNYILRDYDIAMKHLPGDLQALVIAPFADKSEATVYFYALREQPFWKDLTGQVIPKIWRMSRQNLALLQLGGVDQAFLDFQIINYPR